MPWVNVTKRVLPILDLVDPDPDVYSLVNSCVEATDINGCANIVVIALGVLTDVLLWG